jgi:hypothetical protein
VRQGGEEDRRESLTRERVALLSGSVSLNQSMSLPLSARYRFKQISGETSTGFGRYARARLQGVVCSHGESAALTLGKYMYAGSALPYSQAQEAYCICACWCPGSPIPQ